MSDAVGNFRDKTATLHSTDVNNAHLLEHMSFLASQVAVNNLYQHSMFLVYL